jgi:IstB-like ATP binding protein
VRVTATISDDEVRQVLLALHPAGGRPRGDGWARCLDQRAAIERWLGDGIRLTKIRKLLVRQGIEITYPTLHRFAVLERYRTGSVVVTSNRGPDEWLATFADPVRAQSAIDRFTSNAYDLVIDGESYRPRLKPWLAKDATERSR